MIRLPEETFEEVSRRARAMGLSRSEFFTRAARRYLDELDAGSVTRQIDAALEGLGPLPEGSSPDAVVAGRRLLSSFDDEW